MNHTKLHAFNQTKPKGNSEFQTVITLYKRHTRDPLILFPLSSCEFAAIPGRHNIPCLLCAFIKDYSILHSSVDTNKSLMSLLTHCFNFFSCWIRHDNEKAAIEKINLEASICLFLCGTQLACPQFSYCWRSLQCCSSWKKGQLLQSLSTLCPKSGSKYRFSNQSTTVVSPSAPSSHLFVFL